MLEALLSHRADLLSSYFTWAFTYLSIPLALPALMAKTGKNVFGISIELRKDVRWQESRSSRARLSEGRWWDDWTHRNAPVRFVHLLPIEGMHESSTRPDQFSAVTAPGPGPWALGALGCLSAKFDFFVRASEEVFSKEFGRGCKGRRGTVSAKEELSWPHGTTTVRRHTHPSFCSKLQTNLSSNKYSKIGQLALSDSTNYSVNLSEKLRTEATLNRRRPSKIRRFWGQDPGASTSLLLICGKSTCHFSQGNRVDNFVHP